MPLGEKNCMDSALWRQWLSPAQEGIIFYTKAHTKNKNQQTNKNQSTQQHMSCWLLYTSALYIAKWIIPALLINRYFAGDKKFCELASMKADCALLALIRTLHILHYWLCKVPPSLWWPCTCLPAVWMSHTKTFDHLNPEQCIVKKPSQTY